MSTVFIPAVLRANVGGVKSLELEGDSIRAVVDELVSKHPSLGSQLLTDDGDLRGASRPGAPPRPDPR